MQLMPMGKQSKLTDCKQMAVAVRACAVFALVRKFCRAHVSERLFGRSLVFGDFSGIVGGFG